MNLSTIKKAERIAWRAMKGLEQLAKADKAFTAEAEAASKVWLKYYNLKKQLTLARAMSEPVIWTVFTPDNNGVRELIRTRGHTISFTHWKGVYSDQLRPRAGGYAHPASKYSDPIKAFVDAQQKEAA